MELIDVISQLKVLLREAATYQQCGNVDDAGKMLLSMKAYLEEIIPSLEFTQPPNPEVHPPTTEVE